MLDERARTPRTTAMRVYHFINREFGLQDLRERRLKIATIRSLNDPFDLMPMTIRDPQRRQKLRDWRHDVAERFGLLCFSTSWQNPVRWSHYAEKHTGICLGFDVADQFLMPIEYRPRPHPDLISPAHDTNNGELGETAVRKLISTKYSHWRYEKEVRMFMELSREQREGDLYFHPFDTDMQLAEVIVGAESVVSRSEVSDALGRLASHVTAFKARLAFGSFRVVRQKKGVLWQ